MLNNMSMRILGIDPGYERLGLAVIERPDDLVSNKSKKDVLLFSECFKTSPKAEFPDRLKMIGDRLEVIFAEYRPEMVAIETLFFTNNQKTAMHVAEVRGVILYISARHNAMVREFTPPSIKLATTGHGQSDKRQIIAMIPRLINIEKEIAHDDEYDAIAVAITCLAMRKSLQYLIHT